MTRWEHNPGSREAGDAGCTCPVLDNGHGRGRTSPDGNPLWWIADGCPMHAPPSDGEKGAA